MIQVLLIEDDKVLLENLADVLRAEKFDVLTAGDGETALTLASQAIPDLIVSDIMLPGMDGLQLIQRLSKEPHTATIPIIFLTAKTANEDIRAGLDLGAEDYLFKPCTADKLLSTIRLRLDRRKQLEHKLTEKWRGLRQTSSVMAPAGLQLPLQHILGFSEILASHHESMDRAEIGKMSQEIAAAAFRTSRTLTNFFIHFQFQSTEAGKIPEDWQGPGATDPGAAIRRAARGCGEGLGRSEDIRVEAEPTAVSVPEKIIEKVTLELIDNACRYTQPRTPIQVSGSQTSEGYRVVVRDQGPGLTTARLEELKRTLAGSVDATKPSGLSTALLLLRSRGIELEVESTPLDHTTFAFTILDSNRK